MNLVYRIGVYALLMLGIAPALAQNATCPAIVERALAAADAACAATGRNQACYGSLLVEAQGHPDAAGFAFAAVGDVVDVADLQTLRLTPLDEAAATWGVALLRLQANLPDTLPGQNVTFLLFGDVEITNAVTPEVAGAGLRPMQAFYLRTGAGDAACAEAPESGLLVQTPEGAGEITFNVNGVDVQMGSTVFMQAEDGQSMTVSTLEGAAAVTAQSESQVIVAGSWVRIPLDRRRLPSGPPELPLSYASQSRLLEALPLRLLPRPIRAALPLTPVEVEQIHARIEAGEPLCGEAPFPECELFGPPPDLRPCILRPRPGDRPLPAGERRPFCPDLLPPGPQPPPTVGPAPAPQMTPAPLPDPEPPDSSGDGDSDNDD